MSHPRIFLALILVATLTAFSTGCSGGSRTDLQDTSHEVGQDSFEGSEAAAAMEKAAAPQRQGQFTGQVMETMDGGGYTYVLLESDGESVWAAGPKSSIEVGEELSVSVSMVMRDFYSDTLERGFDSIYFVGGFTREAHAGKGGTASTQDGGGSKDPHAGLDMDKGLISGDYGGSSRSLAPGADDVVSGIEKPADGHTIAELWMDREKLAGETVVFRGRVIKYNSQIMGSNWLHLQDGSGDPAQQTHDVTVTTQQVAKVGDIVTVRGVLAVDKDFGAGYKYSMIVEDANLDLSL